LSQEHNAQAEIKTKEFPDIHSFLTWKRTKEAETNSEYVQQCSSQSSATSKRWYYYCNRAGIYKERGAGIRQLKMQGSSKIGQQCTAHMKVCQTHSGQVNIEYCDYHSHSIQIGHLSLPEHVRLTVASKLKEGVAIDSILDHIRDQASDSLGREHLISRQDVHNIKRQYNIDGVERHKNDQTSVCAWVEELQLLDYNPIVTFKPQGMEKEGSLGKDDFILVIQTKFQCDMMKMFGPALVCVDATHGTNHYDFKLVTVIVLDEFGEGVPVAWMISNKEDAVTLCEFLKALQDRTGPMTTKYFMSDDAEQYYSSWNHIYGGNPKKLLCTWHIDRAWRVNIRSMISDNKKQIAVYHQLRTLLEESSIVRFREMLQQSISWMLTDPDLARFCQYFQSWYCKRIEVWAYCYRIGTPVNTNMSVEAFHRVLKVVYLEGKHNRRIDHLLSTLLRIARDKVYDRLIKAEKGKSTHRICEINKRHRAAIEMKKHNQVKQVEELVWKVPSATREGIFYVVRRVTQSCDCKLRCGFCDTCIHMYNCSCIDSAIHNTVCKHTHLVQLYMTGTCDPTQTVSQHDAHSSQPDNLDYFTQVLRNEKVSPSQQQVEPLKREMKLLLSEVQGLADETDNCDVLKAGLCHVRSAVSIMKALQKPHTGETLTKKKRVAPNTNHELQSRFTSTKKKRTTQTQPSLAKPTSAEMEECRTNLVDTAIKVCAICFREDDHSDQSEMVEWIQCLQCCTWVHISCIASTDQTLSDYTCDLCV